MKESLDLPEGSELTVAGQQLVAKGPLGEVTRMFPSSKLKVAKEGNSITVESKIENAKMKSLVKTFKKHIQNMVNGVQEPFVYKLKAASVHFPMNLAYSGNIFKITNFLGSKKPIEVKMPAGIEVNIQGTEITIISPNIELAGMAATKLEQATRLSNKDRRVFQDGIFMTEKAGNPIR